MKKDYLDTTLSSLERAEALLEEMTLKEKVGQLNQKLYGFCCYEQDGEKIVPTQEFQEEVKRYSGLGVLYGLYRADPWSKRDFQNGLYKERAIRAYNTMQRYVIEHSRLGIPMLLSTECPHGHQALEGYLLPVNLAAGATFDPELYQEACAICAKQLKELGVDLALVSMLDVLRDPRWGRSEECYGEDPILSARMAKAACIGYQKEGVTVVAKHFAAQGETSGGINASAARIGERELREIHLPAMEACARENVGGVMAAYNEIDGIYCHANPYLLQTILREEMGFRGIVMADGVAIDQLNVLSGDVVKSGALALRSGVDVGLWDEAFSRLEEAVKRGYVLEEEIDRAVLRVLMLKFERGLFDHPYLDEEKSITAFTYENYSESKRMAEESVILLKNEKEILPLPKRGKIAVIGPHADEIYHQIGDYSPPVRSDHGRTLLSGILEEAKDCSEQMEISYARGCGIFEGTKEELEEAVCIARQSDYIVLAIGGSSSRFGTVTFDSNGAAIIGDDISMDCGEGVDCAKLELSQAQKRLFDALCETEKPIITIMISGRPMLLEKYVRSSNALLQCFYPGPMGGKAIAEIIFGKICPSGVLPVSMPRHAGQIPVFYNYKSSSRAFCYYDLEKTPLFPFGFGMSYTKFSCIEVKQSTRHLNLHELEQKDLDEVCATFSVAVQNIGECVGTAVLLLYLHDKEASIVRRVRELKDFCRIELKAGEKGEIPLHLTIRDLMLFNSSMKQVIEAGEFELMLSLMGETIWTSCIFVHEE